MATDAARGRLTLPSTEATAVPIPSGRSELEVDGRVVGLVHRPAVVRRLVILLHGAGGTAEAGLRLLRPYADERRLLLYAPQSAGRTWDVIEGGYGPDVRRLQGALERLREAYSHAPEAPVIGGFSDGASYALSLGLTNGELFDAVLAFSPGFMAPAREGDRPAFFLSHGRSDAVLPIDRCSRRLVRALRTAGYRVRYHEFDGGHEVPAEAVTAALDWLADPDTARAAGESG